MTLDAFILVIIEIVIITYSSAGSSRFQLSVCISLFSSVAAGLCVDESPAPPGSGGAAQEEMLQMISALRTNAPIARSENFGNL